MMMIPLNAQPICGWKEEGVHILQKRDVMGCHSKIHYHPIIAYV